MAKYSVDSVRELQAQVGNELFVTDWLTIEQSRIDAFADATNDHQWIHVDPERAKRESPFGATIAHGFLTLSLTAGFFIDNLEIRKRRRGINCGMNRVRFVAPVVAGGRVRGRHKLLNYEPVEGGAELTWQVTIDLEGSEKPACVVEVINRIYE